MKGTIAAIKAIIAGTKTLVTAIMAGGWIAVVIIIICVLLGGSDCNVWWRNRKLRLYTSKPRG